MKSIRIRKRDVTTIIIEAAWEIAKPHLKKLAERAWDIAKKKIKERRR